VMKIRGPRPAPDGSSRDGRFPGSRRGAKGQSARPGRGALPCRAGKLHRADIGPPRPGV